MGGAFVVWVRESSAIDASDIDHSADLHFNRKSFRKYLILKARRSIAHHEVTDTHCPASIK